MLNVAAAPGTLREREFNLGTHCVTDLYLSCLGRLDVGRVRKVLVRAVESSASDGSPPSIRVLDDVVIADLPFDFGSYWGSEEGARKRAVLDVLQAGLILVCAELGWSTELFGMARDCVNKRELRNAQFWKRRNGNPSGTVWAQVFYAIDQTECVAEVVFTDREGTELQRSLLFSIAPSDYELYERLGRLEWISDYVVVLYGRLGDERWEAVFRGKVPER